MIDLEHIARRLMDPFDPASRFYWPLAVGAFAAIAANVAWYYWRQREAAAPEERALRPWAFWINVIFLIWALVLLIAKQAFFVIALSLFANVAILAYLYGLWLPPREAAWAREQRRLRYIPRPERRKKRRR